MDLDLKSFSLTLAVGVVSVSIYFTTLWVLDRRPHRILSRAFARGDERLPVLTSVMLAVLALAIGFVCEDLSKNAINRREPSALTLQLTALLPSESAERCSVFVKDERNKTDNELGKSRQSCFDSNFSKSVQLTEVGDGALTTLTALVRHHVASVEEVRVHAELADSLKSDKCPEDMGELTDAQKPKCFSYDRRVPKRIEQFYYLAKNTAYTDSNFFRELEAIRLRFDFERSVCFVLILGIFVVSFAYLARSTQDMWRDVGAWKMLVSVLLTPLLVLGLWDVVATPEWTIKASPSVISACEARLMAQVPTAADNAHDVCKNTIQRARNWILPAALFFVCAYRLRRVGQRAWSSVSRSVFSTVPGPPLLKHKREREAARALTALSVLGAAIIPVYYAYEADQINYLNRVFAYYVSARSPALTCGEQSCLPAERKKNESSESGDEAGN